MAVKIFIFFVTEPGLSRFKGLIVVAIKQITKMPFDKV